MHFTGGAHPRPQTCHRHLIIISSSINWLLHFQTILHGWHYLTKVENTSFWYHWHLRMASLSCDILHTVNYIEPTRRVEIEFKLINTLWSDCLFCRKFDNFTECQVDNDNFKCGAKKAKKMVETWRFVFQLLLSVLTTISYLTWLTTTALHLLRRQIKYIQKY